MSYEIQFVSEHKKLLPTSIFNFETKVGYTFPKNYKEFMCVFNGALVTIYIDAFDFYSNMSDKMETYGLARFLAWNENEDADINTIQWHWENRNTDSDYPFPEHVIPFAIDGSGEKICFDFRNALDSSEPKVVVWHHEATPGSKEELSFVANSFNDFINKLYDDRTAEEKAEDEEVKLIWSKLR